MTQPPFEVVDLPNDAWAINAQGRTVALVTSQGYIDWLLRSPLEPGPLISALRKETHLSYVLGLKLLLVPPYPSGDLHKKTWEHIPAAAPGTSGTPGGGGSPGIKLTGYSRSKDGRFTSVTTAMLSADAATARYLWDCRTTMTCRAAEPVIAPALEFQNILPARTGRCFLCAPDKQYRSTLIVDRDGVVWDFPHQHLFHYSQKISQLHFAPGSLGGFFGETTGSPVVVVHRATHELDWAICDMYYDLHCQARVPEAIRPGETLAFDYTIKYLSRAESEALQARARRIPITDADRASHAYPRLELGMNGFIRPVDVGAYDDASGFRPEPPAKVWDREVGHTGKGSLRLWSDKPAQVVWTAAPPSEIPNQKTLSVSAMARTQDVTGKGVFLRVRYHTFHWRPEPHVEWALNFESNAVTGTTDGWVKITLPPLPVPEEHFDYLVCFDVVLEGAGTAWVTDVDVDMSPTPTPPESLEAGSGAKRARAANAASTAPSGPVPG